MSIKLIAFDMDYTLLRTGGALSDFTAKTLREAQKRGIITVPVTGRNLEELESLLPALGEIPYAVTVNGCVVWDLQTKTRIYRETAPQAEMLKMLKKAISMDIYTEVYSGSVYTNPYCYENMAALGMPPDQVPLFKATRTVVPDLYKAMEELGAMEKMHLVFYDVPDKLKRQGVFLGHPEFSYTAAYVNNLELCSNKVNKANGLGALAEHLGLLADEVMALGDGANDACMLEWAGLGVAMANAVPEAKEAADILTLSNDEDGAAVAIEKYCF
ncbi:MAG: HAD family phosphatase [Ruminococcaceae bacterium]|nr:HAD family phosphatase [Oscillospiraceae bacterium]